MSGKEGINDNSPTVSIIIVIIIVFQFPVVKIVPGHIKFPLGRDISCEDSQNE